MARIEKILEALQPYVIGIRFLEGTPIVDAVFKEGWTIPEDQNIKKIKGNDEMNYYMIFTETAGIGIDELLGYVDKTIKLNQEREKKHELLRTKVNELKEIFQKNSLAKLNNLKFVLTEDLMPKIDEFNLGDALDEELQIEPTYVESTPIEKPTEQPTPTNQSVQYLDENRQPIALSAEDIEAMEEEARAERNRQLLAKKKTTTNPIAKKIELPPKTKIQQAVMTNNFDTDCECGPNEACDKCIDSKDM